MDSNTIFFLLEACPKSLAEDSGSEFFILTTPLPTFLIAEWQADPVHHHAAWAEWQQESFSESFDLQGSWSLCAFPLSQTGLSEPV